MILKIIKYHHSISWFLVKNHILYLKRNTTSFVMESKDVHCQFFFCIFHKFLVQYIQYIQHQQYLCNNKNQIFDFLLDSNESFLTEKSTFQLPDEKSTLQLSERKSTFQLPDRKILHINFMIEKPTFQLLDRKIYISAS